MTKPIKPGPYGDPPPPPPQDCAIPAQPPVPEETPKDEDE